MGGGEGFLRQRTLWAVLTAEDARDSRGDMGSGVRFMMARNRE